jgi:hypothetical protein
MSLLDFPAFHELAKQWSNRTTFVHASPEQDRQRQNSLPRSWRDVAAPTAFEHANSKTMEKITKKVKKKTGQQTENGINKTGMAGVKFKKKTAVVKKRLWFKQPCPYVERDDLPMRIKCDDCNKTYASHNNLATHCARVHVCVPPWLQEAVCNEATVSFERISTNKYWEGGDGFISAEHLRVRSDRALDDRGHDLNLFTYQVRFGSIHAKNI